MGERRLAIITGAARRWGIGYATASSLAFRGYDICIADVRDDWGESSALELETTTGRRVIYHHTDVSDRDAVRSMVERVSSTFGRIDALINDAAIGSGASTENFTDEQFHRVISINLLGAMLCAQAVVPAMKQAGYGRIVNVASTAPFSPPPSELSSVALYNASKGGLIAWTKSAAVELAQHGIVVNVVAVGGLSTGMGQDQAPTAAEDEYMESVVHRGLLPWRRVLRAEEAGEVVAMAADMPNHAMLGATIHASGGRVMPL
jgi:NAD(P)-dependent dehydrogenase (short-subunit alcohol dehydrogenase family)